MKKMKMILNVNEDFKTGECGKCPLQDYNDDYGQTACCEGECLGENQDCPLQEEVDKDEYIKSLENTLIFMCKNYDETDKALHDLASKDDNDAVFKVPRIQGTPNIIRIAQIGSLEFEQPKHSFKEILEEISKNK